MTDLHQSSTRSQMAHRLQLAAPPRFPASQSDRRWHLHHRAEREVTVTVTVAEEEEAAEALAGRHSWLEYWPVASRSCAKHEEASTLEPTAARHIFQIPRHRSEQRRVRLPWLHQYFPVAPLRRPQAPHLQFFPSPS